MGEPAYEAIAARYAQQIRDGVFPPGVQLPSYSSMAAQNGVSEIVVRRVVDVLARQGLVYTIERRGTFVAEQRAAEQVICDAAAAFADAVTHVVPAGPARDEVVSMINEASRLAVEQLP
ncbi:winged helix-turn-helix domain-containing protein [Nocardia asiatica]|uniref:winged helix-turn-helix domain-containing protein n=1 Tax=Nocardia asiatica TaxID=209252 RepID=UPI002453F1BC|nr:GntR family transcriptional regulator [Nocardia asiatica]